MNGRLPAASDHRVRFKPSTASDYANSIDDYSAKIAGGEHFRNFLRNSGAFGASLDNFLCRFAANMSIINECTHGCHSDGCRQ